MLKPDQLPSGKWRCRFMIKGKSYTVIDADKTACIRRAAIMMGDPNILASTGNALTLIAACQEYIDLRSNVLSPWSVTTYNGYIKRLGDIASLPVRSISAPLLQRFVNSYASKHSPKSTRSLYGFIATVLRTYAPDIKYNILLPQKVRPELNIPEDDQVSASVDLTTDPHMRLAICLCAFLGLRRGEISALRWRDLSGSVLHISHAFSKGPDGWTLKAPKTDAGNRYLTVPEEMLPMFDAVRPSTPAPEAFIVPLTPDAITRRWERLCSVTGNSCRFYDLRHYNASTMLALGIPDLYAMQRMGHATPDMLKKVYQHLQSMKQSDVTSVMSAHTASVLKK